MIDESVLTGESQPVDKISDKVLNVKSIFEAQNIAFSGTAVVSGEAKGIVIHIGSQTELGHVAQLSASIVRPSIYEKELTDFSRLVFITVLITISLIFALNVILKRQPNFISFIIFCVALIVGLVPEALPVVVSASLSRGALKLLKKKVVVKRLSSIEDLGDMEVLCTDKTGTLTENRLKIEQIISPEENKLLFYFLLVSPLAVGEKSTNPLDQTVLEAFSSRKLEKHLFQTKILASLPFDFQRLRSSVLFEKKIGEKVLIVRGTADSIIPLCTETELNESLENSLESIKTIESQQGQRVIVLAFKSFNQNQYSVSDEKGLTLLGYLSFSDPLKVTAPETIKLAKKLKVKIKILTGDSKEVAGKIAYDVGLINNVSQVILGSDLDNLDEETLFQKCNEFSVFARVSPETKLKIIKTLQKQYEVGFLGEGINDALALKIAHVGVAVKEATEVSREAADILLLDSDLKVIVEGIREGRIIFANINKYIRCALSSNFGNFYSIAIMSLILPFLPMLPPQILLENILSDTPLITIANDSVDLKDLRRPKMYTLSKTFPYILILALISSAFDFIFLAIFHKESQALLQTSWFTLSLITEILLIISVRTRHVFFKAARPSKNLIIVSLGIIFLTLILPLLSFGQNLFSFVPLQMTSLLIILGLSLAYLFANELAKSLYFRYH
jgi:Mg2+-importing ATPase